MVVFHTSFKSTCAFERFSIIEVIRDFVSISPEQLIFLFITFPVLSHESVRTHATVKLRLQGCTIIIFVWDDEPWALPYKSWALPGSLSAHVELFKIVSKPQSSAVTQRNRTENTRHRRELSSPLSGGIIHVGKDKDNSNSSWFILPLQCARQINLKN